jgi:hypothetical protein
MNAAHLRIPLSEVQISVRDAVLDGKSVAVNACAGSGKTHTAIATAKCYDGKVKFLCLMTNLREDIAAKTADSYHINVNNYHKEGYAMLGKPKFDDEKMFSLVKSMPVPEDIPLGKVVELARKLKAEAVGTWDLALLPYEVAVKYRFSETLVEYAETLLKLSDEKRDVVDFQDMLRFPVMEKMNINFDGLLVCDEVQDFSPDAFQFVKLYKVKQVLLIGDVERQCIMQFTGANSSLFGAMAAHFDCNRYAMEENRRCSHAVIRNARHKGQMTGISTTIEGSVGEMPKETFIEECLAGKHATSAVMSECNAPVLTLAIQLLVKGVQVQVRADKLQKLINSAAYPFLLSEKVGKDYVFKNPLGTIAQAMRNASTETGEDGVQKPAIDSDIIDCIEALESLAMAKGMVKSKFERNGSKWKVIHPIYQALALLLESKSGIVCLTGHTAKGLEWDHTFHLPSKGEVIRDMHEWSQENGKDLQDWECEQWNCVGHIIDTRARISHTILAGYPVVLDNESEGEGDDE